jgi:asparagine synthase (glutamine-hydrolysing)
MLGLVISFTPETGTEKRQSIINRAQYVMENLYEEQDRISLFPSDRNAGHEIIFLAKTHGFPLPEAKEEKDNFIIPLCLGSSESLKTIKDPSDLSWLEDMAPPFGVFQKGTDGVICATDLWGLKHLYSTQQEGVVYVATSAILLGLLTGNALDWDSLVTFSLSGFYLDTTSLYQNVHKLNPGRFWRVKQGRIQEECYFELEREQNLYPSIEAAANDGYEMLKSLMQTIVEHHEQLNMELSGGFDSRLLFCVFPKEYYHRLHTITLGTPAHPDYVIAKMIADKYQVSHQFVNLEEMNSSDIEAIIASAQSNLLEKDLMVNILSSVVLNWVESHLNQKSRLSGVNGEIARGFYYTGQTDQTGDVTKNIDRIINWRIMINEKVDPRIFKTTVHQKGYQNGVQRIHRLFDRYPGSLLQKSDWFYLFQRMNRWAGSGLSSACQHRPVIAPFFDKRFVTWAFKVPCEYKRQGRIFAEIMKRFNSDLASLSLAGGPCPSDIVRPTVLSDLKKKVHFLGKVASKLAQKAGWDNKNAIGVPLLFRCLSEKWTRSETSLDWLDCYPALQKDFIVKTLKNKGIKSPSTLSFLLSLKMLSDVRSRFGP